MYSAYFHLSIVILQPLSLAFSDVEFVMYTVYLDEKDC